MAFKYQQLSKVQFVIGLIQFFTWGWYIGWIWAIGWGIYLFIKPGALNPPPKGPAAETVPNNTGVEGHK